MPFRKSLKQKGGKDRQEGEVGKRRRKMEIRVNTGPSSSRENKGSVIWEFSSGASVDNNLAQPYIQQKYNAELSFAREYLLASKCFRRSNRFTGRCELRGSMTNRVKKPVEKIFAIPIERSPFINVNIVSVYVCSFFIGFNSITQGDYAFW